MLWDKGHSVNRGRESDASSIRSRESMDPGKCGSQGEASQTSEDKQELLKDEEKSQKLQICYRVDGVDVTQETERN